MLNFSHVNTKILIGINKQIFFLDLWKNPQLLSLYTHQISLLFFLTIFVPSHLNRALERKDYFFFYGISSTNNSLNASFVNHTRSFATFNALFSIGYVYLLYSSLDLTSDKDLNNLNEEEIFKHIMHIGFFILIHSCP